MIQLMVIAFFVVLLVIMPKNNKEERKAAHLLIDKYGIQVAKKNNPVRQMALLEVALGISTYRGSRKKTFIFIGSFFVIAIILGYLTYFFGINQNITGAIIVGIILALYLIAGTIVMFVIAIRQASSLRTTDAWAKILNTIDPQFPVEFLNEKKWQKAFLAQMESMNEQLA
ncbi:hypothetical protein [Listeria monocytogenes]|uniref:hypothetical protein n=1 Tax=Listeria monocytogenes TaxID=1639 RepID=UPI000A16FEFC|nr:hypothetical protein [Listeria monocytogenes]EAC3659502.1 hypothetical protein [Listeria monocytogenes]EAE2181307.1 hypothetical protein [Listeria monocytogenes]EAE2240213.1 hypothetical protein [Listeria monocytogenes]EEP3750623.1 hypothetical protein [Listeria monocytogenes]EEP6716772.1 hypothetical protein [Listeria monocytogenes]